MQDKQSTSQIFERLVGDLLSANGFEIQNSPTSFIVTDYDFNCKLDHETWAIEVKFYRTARAQISLLESAAARLSNSINNNRNLVRQQNLG